MNRIAIATGFALLLFPGTSRATSFGLSVDGAVTSAVPQTTVVDNQAIVLPAANNLLQGFDSGLLVQDNYFGAPISTAQMITYFDPLPNANGLFTSDASASVHVAAITKGLLIAWVDSRSGDADINTIPYTGATASAKLLWLDGIPVTVPGLPVGTPVLYAINNHLSADFQASGALEQAFLNSVNDVGPAHFANNLSYGIQGTPDSVQGLSIFNQQIVVNTFVGAVLQVEEQLTVQTSGIGGAFGEIVAQNTAFLNIQALTPGASTIGVSGLDYSTVGEPAPTVVPEPASMLLLGTGLIGVGARRWRNRRQRG